MTDPSPRHARPALDDAFDSPWSGQTIPQVFELTAAAHPARVAIDDGVARVTYAELSDRAGRVAALLADRLAGTGAGQHVALLARVGVDAVAGMLGSMSAGHVYVPLDPDDPPGRLRALLDDSEACVVLADRANLAHAEALAGGHIAVLPLDDLSAPAHHRVTVPDPDAVAFLTYTSGSTGRPKGVLHQHRARLHAFWHYSRFHSLGPDDRTALLFALSFGASSLVVYGSLLNGATLCLPQLHRRGVAALAAWLDAERITMAHSVPTTWRALLTQPVPLDGLRALRTYDLGGEALFAHDVAAWRARFGSTTRLTTRLAATEVSLITQCEIDDEDGPSGPLAVGPAAPGVHLTILRDDGCPANANEPGELVIHTPHVSAGYWRQPELTAQRFADDPDRPGWRIYRGGDRGVLDPQGRLTVLGRADAVVRVRGYSVHLAEVEAALRRVDGVDDAAVVVAGEGDVVPADPRIIAFFT
ncbi:MAG: AMP-binding protein, partial [Vicinamibacterales bacterium]